MNTLAQFRKTITAQKPLMAYVGTVDLAVEKAREARTDAIARRQKLAAEVTPAKLQDRANTLVDQAKETPAVVQGRVLGLVAQAQEGYAAAQKQAQAEYKTLATRGQKLVRRVLDQKSTKDLVAQAEATVASAKGAVTTVTKGAEDVQTSAKALLTTGRNEASKAADAIALSVTDEVETAATELKGAAARTRTAAKRTTTTTKKATTGARTAAKRTTTSARKTAAGAVKATEKAADKIGS